MPLKRPGAAPTVVLVGRPNVGKSTLFNSITNSRQAIVAPLAGTTRDTNAQPAEWQGNHFSLVDTGGMFGAQTDPLHELVVEHGRKAIAAADLVVFVVDGREGLVPGDEEIASALGRSTAPSSSRSTRPTTGGRRGGPSSSTASGSSRLSRSRPSTARASGICSTRLSRAFPAGHERDAGARQGRRDPRRHRRPAERRQVVAAQSVAERGALDRQRHAGDDAGHGRRRRSSGRSATFRILDTAGIRRPGRVARAGQVEGVAVVDRAPRDREGGRRGAGHRLGRGGDRPGRDDRRRGRQGRAPASSSSPTSGT